MNEGATATEYGKLIKEVFIDPIRTVVVVDDEFPTLDAMLDKEKGNLNLKWKPDNVSLAREIIDFCRDGKRRWMVEIHDGRQVASSAAEDEAASHLHQSDLMILDFHLDKERPNDGSDAIGILRGLAGNDHFNLVVVYTKGYEAAGGDIARVVREIAVRLCSADERLSLSEKSLEAVKGLLEEWEDHQQNIREEIEESIDDGIYLKARTQPPGDINWNDVCLWAELQGLKALVDKAPEAIRSKAKLKLIVKWALHRRQQTVGSKLAPCDYGTVRVDLGGQSETNWIRTNRLFVTVVSKTNKPSELPGKLLTALHLWNPEPHRLLMSKMRAELDERGVLAEGAVLENRWLQAGWLEESLTADADERRWKIHNTINRHWEGLGDEIRNSVSEFAGRLADHLIIEGREDAVQSWYPSLAQLDVGNHLNRYASSKSAVEGCYLTTGHVLLFDNCDQESCHWLCLSPACDLVPGQKKSGWPKRLGEHTPFIAVQLFSVNKEEAVSNAFGGNHLFLEIGGALKSFSFTPRPPAAGSAEVEKTTNPKWEQMFAARQGRFDQSDRALSVSRIYASDGEIRFNPASARVVAHLRYEYALNLLQRLGASLSRVGLDFVGLANAPVVDGQTNA